MTHANDTPVLESIAAFNEIKQDVEWCERKLAGIGSPPQNHRVVMEAARDELNIAWENLFKSTELYERPQLQKRIQNLAGELEILDRVGLRDAEARYKHEVEIIMGAFRKKLGKSVSALLNSVENQTVRESACDDSCQGHISASLHTSQLLHSPADTHQSAACRGACVDTPTSDVEDAEETRKRKRVIRPQSWQAPGAQRSIHFDEVYQNGNAKHIIVQWPPDQGDWFIIRCDEHDFNFKNNPFIGAVSHLRGKGHGKTSSDYNTVVQLFGTKVEACNEDLAQKNNTAVHASPRGTPEYESVEENLRMRTTSGLLQHEPCRRAPG
ncbi:hypothetical protein FDECE_12015 [Fusarium decemcellulare]|nr:hypothetical protein FDECE_12015 [Fusarium decemcellulare]